MADLVKNKVVLPKELGDLFLTMNEDGSYRFDFNNIIPMPDEFDSNLPSGGWEEEAVGIYYKSLSLEGKYEINKLLTETRTYPDGETWTYWKKYRGYVNSYESEEDLEKKEKKFEENDVNRKDYPGCNTLADVGKKYIDQIVKFGSANWYDWNVSHWGTKWNALNTKVKFSKSTNTYTIEFDTAWCVPTGIMKKISELCGEEQFNWVAGREKYSSSFTIENGEIVENQISKARGSR